MKSIILCTALLLTYGAADAQQNISITGATRLKEVQVATPTEKTVAIWRGDKVPQGRLNTSARTALMDSKEPAYIPERPAKKEPSLSPTPNRKYSNEKRK